MRCYDCGYCTKYVFGVQCDNVASERYGKRVGSTDECNLTTNKHTEIPLERRESLENERKRL